MSSLPASNGEEEVSKDDLHSLEIELLKAEPQVFKGVNKKQKDVLLRSIVSITATMHSGPLPDPSTLNEYDQLIPNGADRIMKMAEEQSKHRRGIEKKAIGRQSAQSLIGQIFGLIIGLAGLAAGTYIVHLGHTKTGGVIAGGTVVSLVSVFVLGRRRSKNSES